MLVDEAQKRERIMAKQIRQSTTKILQRPSAFHARGGPQHQEVMSKPLMTALLNQKREGRLNSPTLEQWVQKYQDDEEGKMIDEQFEALHKELESEYAKRKLDSAIPPTAVLDTASAKQKRHLVQRRSFRAKGERTCKDNDGATASDQKPKGTLAKDIIIPNGQVEARKTAEKEDDLLSLERSLLSNQQRLKQLLWAKEQKVLHMTTPEQGERHHQQAQKESLIIAVQEQNSRHSTSKEQSSRHQVGGDDGQVFPSQLGREPDVIPKQVGLHRYFAQKMVESLERRKPSEQMRQQQQTQQLQQQQQEQKHQQYQQQKTQQELQQKQQLRQHQQQEIYSDSTYYGSNIYEEIGEAKKPRRRKGVPQPPKSASTVAATAATAVTASKTANADAPLAGNSCATTNSNGVEITDIAITDKQKKTAGGGAAPFERFQNCLFSAFTACVPWCIMRQVYWKYDKTSEEIFSVSARRNSRTRNKIRNNQHVE